ncbi:AgrD family cyclic lactone autoinducer peptide [Shewanella hafniensis]
MLEATFAACSPCSFIYHSPSLR